MFDFDKSIVIPIFAVLRARLIAEACWGLERGRDMFCRHPVLENKGITEYVDRHLVLTAEEAMQHILNVRIELNQVLENMASVCRAILAEPIGIRGT